MTEGESKLGLFSLGDVLIDDIYLNGHSPIGGTITATVEEKMYNGPCTIVKLHVKSTEKCCMDNNKDDKYVEYDIWITEYPDGSFTFQLKRLTVDVEVRDNRIFITKHGNYDHHKKPGFFNFITVITHCCQELGLADGRDYQLI